MRSRNPIEQAEAKADKARKMFRVVGNDPEAENISSDGADKPM
jgi:hypothetical protein